MAKVEGAVSEKKSVSAKNQKPAMTQSSVVLVFKRRGLNVTHFIYPKDPGENYVGTVKDLYMPNRDFEDIGSPTTITVTIKPGDALNV